VADLLNGGVVFDHRCDSFEDGPGGIPADIKIEKCACNFPNTYAIVLRNTQRAQVDRVYGGLNFIDDSKGVVLIENPKPAFRGEPHTQQCHLFMVELEANESATAPATVRIRSPEDAVTLNDPGDAPAAEATSARNRFEGTVRDLRRGRSVARVWVGVAPDESFVALVTNESLGRLDLSDGDPVVASFKATATRGVPGER